MTTVQQLKHCVVSIMLCCMLFQGLCIRVPDSRGAEPAAALSAQEKIRLGERIYREGILSSGEPVKAVVQRDVPVTGTMFSCASCHMRGGHGSFEGNVITPPATGRLLYQPYFNGVELSRENWLNIPANFRPEPSRPAYTDDTLADALRSGIDPAGRELDYVMPRYQVDDGDMEYLIAYLKTFSTTPSPGVTATTLRFATVVAGEVSPEDRAAMLIPLESYVRDRNSQATVRKTRTSSRWGVEEMNLSSRRLALSVWELKGPPENWRRQLDEYYRKEPVFALIGGISNGEWRPVHEFCETNRIPSILPVTNFPVISESDWYTLYFSKGIFQEGEAAARFLRRNEDLHPDDTVIQIFRETREGRAAAAGFRETWQSLGN